MTGTLNGGKKAAVTNKVKYGPDFYRKIGKKGGKTLGRFSHLRGFGSNRELASKAGQKGGRISVRPRGKKTKYLDNSEVVDTRKKSVKSEDWNKLEAY